MKKILITMFLAGSITLCFAQWQQNPQRGGPSQDRDYQRQGGNYNQNSALIINTVSQRPFSVSVDDQGYQSNGNNNTTLHVGQLNSGNHRIIVYEEKKNFWGKQVQHIVYNSSVNLRPGFETTISINSFGQANISERQMSNSNMNGQKGYGKNDNNGKGHAYGKYKNKHPKNHHDDDDEYGGSKGRNNRGENDRD